MNEFKDLDEKMKMRERKNSKNEFNLRIFKTIENHESVFSERELARALVRYTDNAEVFTSAILQIKNSTELQNLVAS